MTSPVAGQWPLPHRARCQRRRVSWEIARPGRGPAMTASFIHAAAIAASYKAACALPTVRNFDSFLLRFLIYREHPTPDYHFLSIMNKERPMHPTLFRREAIEATSRRLVSESRLVTPISFSVFSSFLLTLTVATILFLCLGSYTRKDVVRGYVTTTEGNIRVYAQSEGVILQSLVREGEVVEKDQSLFVLSTSRASNRSAEVGLAVIESLGAEKQALLVQIDKEKDNFVARGKSIQEEIISAEKQLRSATDQLELVAKGLTLAQNEFDRFRNISDPTFVSESELDRAATSVLEFELRQKELQLEVDRLKGAITQQRHQLAQVPIQRDARLAELTGELSRMSQRIASESAQAEQMVVAPSAGRVSALTARTGQTVTGQRPLLNLIPSQSVFYVELFVPSRSIGFVDSSTAVNIRFDAFPYQKFGVYRGAITHIAKSVVMPGEISTPVAISEPVYLIRLTLEQQHVDAYGRQFDLRAGMTVSADVLRDRRRLIEWLFAPLISAERRS